MCKSRIFCRVLLLCFVVFSIVRDDAAVDLITRLDPSAVVSESADGPSGLPQVSADGRYVLFTSGANNLIDTQYGNLGISIYVHDRVTHITAQASSTNGGWPGRGDASNGSISADGKTVLFVSTSTNLGAFDRLSGPDVFEKNMETGTITLITGSKTAPGQPAYGGLLASMTPDAQFVLFQSTSPYAAQLTVGDTLGFPDVFVRDVAAQTTTLVSSRASVSTGVAAANQASTPVSISTNGQFVLYYSLASDLISPAFTVYTQRLWLRDLTLQTNTLVSRGATNGNRESAFAASMSPDANVIAFAANAHLEDVNSPTTYSNIFVRIMETDTLKAMALPVDLKTNLSSAVTRVSPTGSRVAVTTFAKVSGTNQPRLFVWDLPSDTMTEVNLAAYGPLDGGSVQPYFVDDSTLLLGSARNSVTNSISVGAPLTIRSIASTLLHASADGSVIAFATYEPLVAGDLNNESDVYVLSPSGVELISAAHPRWRRPLPDMSIHHLQNAHSLTDKIAFMSFSDALVANDTNGFSDIFTWSKSSNVVQLESVGPNGEGANGHSTEPTLSRDGHWLAFVSAASNLVANDTNHMEDVFLKSLDDGSIIRVSESVRPSTIKLIGVRGPVLGSGGRFVAYTSTRSDMTMTNITSLGGAAYVYDRSTGENLWIGAGLGTFGQRAVAIYEPNVYFFVNTTNLYAFNMETRERTLIGPSTADPAVNSDGSLFALQVSFPTNSRVYTYDPATHTTNLVLQYGNNTIQRDQISLSDNKTISFVSSALLSLFDHDTTNDVYTFNLANPSQLRLATTPPAPPLGSGNLVPRSQMISRDGLRLFYLASTNSDVDQVPRRHLYAADILSGATATITGGRSSGAAPVMTMKPAYLNSGLAAVTTARDLFDSPFDKANLFYYADVQDQDGGGLPDIWEMAVFGSLEHTASGDADADGMTNGEEMLAGTNPLSETSALFMNAADRGDTVDVYVRDVTPRPLIVQTSEDISTGVWTDVAVAPVSSGGNFIYSVSKQPQTAFFRVVVAQ